MAGNYSTLSGTRLSGDEAESNLLTLIMKELTEMRREK
jgi:hypothetical protein